MEHEAEDNLRIKTAYLATFLYIVYMVQGLFQDFVQEGANT
jgi:hypothetical protein